MSSLCQDLGLWRLTFQRRQAVLKHETGLLYVAYLLIHPEPIHGLDLYLKVRPPAPGSTPSTPVRLQERSLGLEAAETLRALRRQQRELEAILEDPEQLEPVKAEAERQLEAITSHQQGYGRQTEDAAQKTVRSVRRAIHRLHGHLAAATDAAGQPHPTLRLFGQHLRRHLLIPSARADTPGTFTYEPPPGVKWV